MDENTRATLRGESTREALLDAATEVFARDGFGAANLRAIAEAAGVNQALIGYHFRGKEGLYLAVFDRLTGRIQQTLAPVLAEIDRVLALPDAPDPAAARERYLPALLDLVDGVLTHMVHEHPAWGELILREVQFPGAAFEMLFERIVNRHSRAMTGLLCRLRPDDGLEQVRMLCGALFSQVLAVRHYRTPLMRLLGWERIGDRELALLKALVRRNTTLLVLGD